MKKRKIALAMTCLLLFSLMTGCEKYNQSAPIQSESNTQENEESEVAVTLTSQIKELATGFSAVEFTGDDGVDDLNQTFELLLSGRIDATLNAEVSYYNYMKAQPDANLKIAVLSEDANQIAIPMRKGEETATLRIAIDNALEELSTEGVLSELAIKYFGTDISQNS